MAKILIVEDELSIQKLIEYDLKNAGHECVTCGNGKEAISIYDNDLFDIVLLDYLLPEKTGIEICEYIRNKSQDVYIILLTAVGDEVSKLKAFECGADDYIVKPFSMREVIARIDNALKRLKKSKSNYTFKHLRIDESVRIVYWNDREIELTKTEYELLKFYVENQNNVISREEILIKVWGYDYVGETRTVDVYTHKLREKLGLEEDLKTVRGVGYILRSKI